MNVARLSTLIAYMENLPAKADKHFDMDRWFVADPKRMKQNGFIRGKRDVMGCGVTACALGWAATVPEFKRAGLEVYAMPNDYAKGNIGGLTNTVRGMAFFDLDKVQFEELFVPDEGTDETPKAWAARAKQYLHDNTFE